MPPVANEGPKEEGRKVSLAVLAPAAFGNMVGCCLQCGDPNPPLGPTRNMSKC